MPIQTWSRLLKTGTFWLALLLLCTLLCMKDMAIAAVHRQYTTDPRLLLQEVSVLY